MTSLSLGIPRRTRTALGGVLCVSSLLVACGSDWANDKGYAEPTGTPDATVEPAAGYPQGLHAVGRLIEDDAGNVVTPRGVNRSGTEYACSTHGTLFDGPNDEKSVQAIASWGVNTVRVPLNESCWLGINGVPDALGGDAYKSAILAYVALLHRYALIPIIELHWTAPGDIEAIAQPLIPDLDHAPDAWSDIAVTFTDDTGVIFEPFNEPVYNYYFADAEDAWSCWRDGCDAPDRMQRDAVIPGFQAAGMQTLLDAIRAVESDAGTPSHLVLAGGLDWSNDLSGWLSHAPVDTQANIGAAWHVYSNNGCRAPSCWDGAPADVAAEVPLVVTELGENDCLGDFVTSLMDWLDGHKLGYLAWSWNANGVCEAGSSDKAWSLITDYHRPTPNSEYARAFRDHLALVAAP